FQKFCASFHGTFAYLLLTLDFPNFLSHPILTLNHICSLNRLKQLHQRLKKLATPSKSLKVQAISIKFQSLRVKLNQTLECFLTVNRQFGKLYLAYLLGFVPIHIYFTMFLVHEHRSNWNTL